MQTPSWVSLVLIAVLVLDLAYAQATPTRICLVRASVEGGSNAAAAADTVRGTFTTFLTGPTLSSQLLEAPLAAGQRRSRTGRLSGHPADPLKIVSKQSGGGLLGRIAVKT